MTIRRTFSTPIYNLSKAYRENVETERDRWLDFFNLHRTVMESQAQRLNWSAEELERSLASKEAVYTNKLMIVFFAKKEEKIARDNLDKSKTAMENADATLKEAMSALACAKLVYDHLPSKELELSTMVFEKESNNLTLINKLGCTVNRTRK